MDSIRFSDTLRLALAALFVASAIGCTDDDQIPTTIQEPTQPPPGATATTPAPAPAPAPAPTPTATTRAPEQRPPYVSLQTCTKNEDCESGECYFVTPGDGHCTVLPRGD